MRSMIGNSEMLSVGLAVLIVNEFGEILLEKRSDNGLWCLPGGSLDIGETVIEGAKREVYEETGLVLENLELYRVVSGAEQLIVYPNGDKTYYMDLVFFSKIAGKKPKKNDEESTEIKFFKIDEIPDDNELLRGTKDNIISYINYKGKVTVS